ncbi:MAG: alpha-amylase [Candidatus Margulisbacteria bacterium GWF2_38_17]|nr:MAG: alpha-amylase [Candidatus Margulisbacteria bacterium GWF2_38_17]
MQHWLDSTLFYHIYPLGFCDCPEQNDYSKPAVPRLEKIMDWAEHINRLGVDALYLGPVFESATHGYDTTDYYWVDRRLGNKESLTSLVAKMHAQGIRVILDGVFNHVGRDFWAFRDVCNNLQQSRYCDWFDRLSFAHRSPYNDPFTYEAWQGHYNLVSLNLKNTAVKEHLFQAVREWITTYNIDGLRLDAADCLDLGFIEELGAFCRRIRPDFWLVGEVIHGNYTKWANDKSLDSITNYECYKGLFSSHNDKNYFEIASSLKRQFGEKGIYKHLQLYNFVDNHDVNRLASVLKNSGDLYPLHIILMTMPGIPSIYYGSEWGIKGEKEQDSDAPMRPSKETLDAQKTKKKYELAETISRLAKIRRNSPALKYGNYEELLVAHEHLAFQRKSEQETIITVINSAEKKVSVNLSVQQPNGTQLADLLNQGKGYIVKNGKLHIPEVYPRWGCILKVLA